MVIYPMLIFEILQNDCFGQIDVKRTNKLLTSLIFAGILILFF